MYFGFRFPSTISQLLLSLHTTALAVALLHVALRLRLALLLLILLEVLGELPRQKCAYQKEWCQYDQDLREAGKRRALN